MVRGAPVMNTFVGSGGTSLHATLVSSHASSKMVAFFTRIAQEEGWQPQGEIVALQDHSTYFALQDAEKTLLGGLQLVLPGAVPFPCLKVWPELEVVLAVHPQQNAHVAILAVARQWRGQKGGAPFWLLCAAMWRYCVEREIRTLWLEATPTMLRCYRLLGFPLEVRGELREHWGEPCYPCSLSVRQVAGVLAEKAVRSHTYGRIFATALEPRLNGAS
jgi:hypothetical protein